MLGKLQFLALHRMTAQEMRDCRKTLDTVDERILKQETIYQPIKSLSRGRGDICLRKEIWYELNRLPEINKAAVNNVILHKLSCINVEKDHLYNQMNAVKRGASRNLLRQAFKSHEPVAISCWQWVLQNLLSRLTGTAGFGLLSTLLGNVPTEQAGFQQKKVDVCKGFYDGWNVLWKEYEEVLKETQWKR